MQAMRGGQAQRLIVVGSRQGGASAQRALGLQRLLVLELGHISAGVKYR